MNYVFLIFMLISPVLSANWDIYIPEATWDIMANCTKAEYKSEDRPDKCDYQDAECSYNGDRVACEIRRKGSSTWRDMDSKPSFKIKNMEKDGEDYNFGGTWVTEKMTLNNNVQNRVDNAQVKAYDVFRDLGVISPLAEKAVVNLYRGDVVISSDQEYTQVETIDDKAFMKKHFGSNYALWEVELGGEVKFERDGGDIVVPNVDVTKLSFDDVSNMIAYYTGERLVNHWDGACLKEDWLNNHYIAFDGDKYTFIPSGVDQVFGCEEDSETVPYCSPMQDCFNSSSCKAEFEAFFSLQKAPEKCNKKMSTWLIVFLSSIAFLLLMTVICNILYK